MRRSLVRLTLLCVVLLSALAVSAAAAPTLSEWELPTKDREPNAIALGPDGNVWFTESAGAGAIGRITPAGTITEFTTGLFPASKPTGITAGPDGNLWFTEAAGPGRIGRITPSGTITEFTTGLTTNSQPTGITAGPDGNLWFTEAAGTGRIGRITTSGTITEFTTGLTGNAHPTGITAGPDGALWFTETAGTGRIGRITTGGTITEFSSGLTGSSEPEGITQGSDGALYFTEAKNPGRIGRITTSGTVTETATPTSNSQPRAIVTGGDGNVWFSEVGSHGQIGKLTVAPAVAPGSPTSTQTSAVLKAFVGANSQATTYRFEYGPTSAYGTQTAVSSAGSGASLAQVATSIEGLSPAATYHYRVVASNESGTTYGSDETVATASAPGATTLPADAVTLESAALHASVEPHGRPTTYTFEWGPTTAYGHEAPLGGAEAGSDEQAHATAATIEGLSPDTRYHFRVVASSCGGCAEGTTVGADETFTTAAPPTVATAAASAVSRTGAKLGGSVDPRGAAVSYRFDWGETAAYGSRTNWTPLTSPSGLQAVSETLSGLQAAHVYHFRLIASNCEGCQAGTSYGADMVLVTEALPLAPISAALLTGAPRAAGPPAIGRTALLHVLAGSVTVRTPGGQSVTLSDPANIPVGSTVDTRHGKLELTTAIDTHGDVQAATVWGGLFTLGQSRSAGGMTTMSVPAASSCRRAVARKPALVAREAARKTAETLWARDNHGRYSTRGHDSVATVRGTYWGTSETCAGTRTTVRQGAVSVKPRHGRAVLVRAGHSYLARS
jgi:streptogramin lyase